MARRNFEVDLEYLRAQFSIFYAAMVEWVEKEQFSSADQFISAAAYTFVKGTKKSKQF
jgi:hypothetical protein